MARLETDPVDWKLDLTTWDLIFPLTYTTGSEAIAQRVGINIRMFKGELFTDRSKGYPYLEGPTVTETEAVLGGPADIERATALFRAIIANTEGVARVLQVSATYGDETRELDMSWKAVTIYGKEIEGTHSQEIL